MSFKIKILLIIILIIFLGLFSGYFYFNKQINKANSDSVSTVIVEVKSGTVESVGKSLKEKGLLDSILAFDLYSRIVQKSVYTGYYQLPKNMSPKQLFDALSKEDYKVYKVTIYEGYRSEQIAQKLDEAGITNYAEFLAEAKKNEGYLFPDTYFFKRGMSAQLITKVMKDNFTKNVAGLAVPREKIILASIVERETAGEDRATIAGIYQNRINIKMKLDADPTVQYAKDTNEIKKLAGQDRELLEFKFWKSITSKDYYATESDYNTYKNTGLPPGPICNPGLNSIKAALNPEDNGYIFFFHVKGQIYPSKNLEEHNTLKQKYLYN